MMGLCLLFTLYPLSHSSLPLSNPICLIVHLVCTLVLGRFLKLAPSSPFHSFLTALSSRRTRPVLLSFPFGCSLYYCYHYVLYTQVVSFWVLQERPVAAPSGSMVHDFACAIRGRWYEGAGMPSNG
jgi:hypothetical protein